MYNPQRGPIKQCESELDKKMRSVCLDSSNLVRNGQRNFEEKGRGFFVCIFRSLSQLINSTVTPLTYIYGEIIKELSLPDEFLERWSHVNKTYDPQNEVPIVLFIKHRGTPYVNIHNIGKDDYKHFTAEFKSSRPRPRVEIDKAYLVVKVNCAVCGVTAVNMKKCGRCGLVYYCSTNCQETDWKKNHKKLCIPADRKQPS